MKHLCYLLNIESVMILLLIAIITYLIPFNYWDFANYDTVRTEETFDYIVVGGGTAGCIIASRLSEDNKKKVLLLEAGGEPPMLSNIPSLLFTTFRSKHDWSFDTESQPELKSVKFGSYFPMGKMLGGTSSMNGAIFIRGHEKDYQNWVESGAEGWNLNRIAPYFSISEDVMTATESSKKNSHNLRSSSDQLLNSFANAVKNEGYPITDGHEGVQSGVSFCPLTLESNQRTSPYTNYLYPNLKRENLFVKTEAFAEKIVFDEERKAVAVEYSNNGVKHKAKVNGEIVLSSGVVNSPKLLMLSGIGPKHHLESMNITLIQDLPVGENLKDHFGVMQVADLRLKNLFQPFGYDVVTAFLNTKTHANETDLPDIQMLFFKWTIYYICVTLQLNPESVGSIRLKSKDPKDSPLIDARYLSSENDLNVLSVGMKKASKLLRSIGLEEVEEVDCNYFDVNSDEHWKCKVKSMGKGFYHAVGTCKMGSKNSIDSVVDEKLRVIGVNGLRVADASVFPTQITANPQATVMMIAERVVDFLRHPNEEDTCTCSSNNLRYQI